ncbi:MAG: TetR/AcrR family transcriptional regulator [bacterium]|nr:TetR/AcrR family transcriptional regulator [bacterium]
MPRSITKEALLDAAEAIVLESGAAHLTLDAVAERSRISKGGLIYNFPTKEALLVAMIGRLIENLENRRERIRRELAPQNPSELMIEIKVLSSLVETDARRSAAILAVIANRPDLMEPFRETLCDRFTKRILSEGHPERSTILFFAAFGLHFAEMLSLPFLDPERRKKVYADLLSLARADNDLGSPAHEADLQGGQT